MNKMGFKFAMRQARWQSGIRYTGMGYTYGRNRGNKAKEDNNEEFNTLFPIDMSVEMEFVIVCFILLGLYLLNINFMVGLFFIFIGGFIYYKGK